MGAQPELSAGDGACTVAGVAAERQQAEVASQPMGFAKWVWVLGATTATGVVLAAASWSSKPPRLGYAYLTAYLFFVSLSVGGLFWVMVQHVCDAAWWVPLRRVAEHLAGLAPVLGLLWLPMIGLAPQVYPWMQTGATGAHASLAAQAGLLNRPVWVAVSVGILLFWSLLGWWLRAVSLEQDRTGAVESIRRLRVLSAVGLCGLTVTWTLAAVLWVMALEPHWCSAVYGLYWLAGSAWVTLAVLYGLAVALQRRGPLAQVLGPRQLHDLGVLWFALTLVYAYIHFVQYFVIWNGNIPEYTSWYRQRQQEPWAGLGLGLIVGHVAVPFLALLRRDTKLSRRVTVPLVVWCGLMHYLDVAFNVWPAMPQGAGPGLSVADVGCVTFMGGLLAWVWLKAFKAHPPLPVRDPHLGEALTAAALRTPAHLVASIPTKP